jgi:5,10-methylenetetrahydrofolate reductase
VAGRRVIICELDPPKTLALEKDFAGAQALVQAGCDAITLADNSLAILRVSNRAIGAFEAAQNAIEIFGPRTNVW